MSGKLVPFRLERWQFRKVLARDLCDPPRQFDFEFCLPRLVRISLFLRGKTDGFLGAELANAGKGFHAQALKDFSDPESALARTPPCDNRHRSVPRFPRAPFPVGLSPTNSGLRSQRSFKYRILNNSRSESCLASSSQALLGLVPKEGVSIISSALLVQGRNHRAEDRSRYGDRDGRSETGAAIRSFDQLAHDLYNHCLRADVLNGSGS
jgi:hypothetical protein